MFEKKASQVQVDALSQEQHSNYRELLSLINSLADAIGYEYVESREPEFKFVKKDTK